MAELLAMGFIVWIMFFLIGVFFLYINLCIIFWVVKAALYTTGWMRTDKFNRMLRRK